MRTVSIDRVLQESFSDGVGTVLNLGAGLDARPYRLDIPPGVHWIEADFAEINKYKERLLAANTPRCRLHRVSIDLTVGSARLDLLAGLATYGRPALVLTEGLLPYLSAAEVKMIAMDLRTQPIIRDWVVDFDAGGLDWPLGCRKALQAAPRRFRVPHLMDLLRSMGWEAHVQIGAGEEAPRLQRSYPVRYPRRLIWHLLPAHWRNHIQNTAGVALLRKL